MSRAACVTSTTLPPPPAAAAAGGGGGDDWQNELTLTESNRYMLDNQLDCDVWFTLLPAGGAELPVTVGAHRYVLVSRSPVFFAMLSGPLAATATSRTVVQPSPSPSQHRRQQQQQQQQQQRAAAAAARHDQQTASDATPSTRHEIRISDIAPNTFWQLLRYLYCEQLELSEDSVFAVLYAAKKYLVTSLARRCVVYLESVLSPENVCMFLENVFLFEDEYPALRQRCFQVVESQSKKVFHSEAFYEMSKDTLCRVLRVDRLSVHEIDVFRACLHWAERRASLLNLALTPANKRQVLGDSLRLIHFPAMSVDEFTKIVVPAALLDVDEENAVFRALLDPEAASPGRPAGPVGPGEAPSPPRFPRSSRNFVTTRCDIRYEDGFTRHAAAAASSSLFRGGGAMPQRSGWSLTVYCDHSIKIQEIGFFGSLKGSVYVMQHGYRKMDVSSASPTPVFRFDDLQLDAGHFTVAADAPFTYAGDYFARLQGRCTPGGGGGGGGGLPSTSTDHDRACSLVVRESSPLGVVSYIVFVPTDEIYFIDNYYSDDS